MGQALAGFGADDGLFYIVFHRIQTPPEFIVHTPARLEATPVVETGVAGNSEQVIMQVPFAAQRVPVLPEGGQAVHGQFFGGLGIGLEANGISTKLRPVMAEQERKLPLVAIAKSLKIEGHGIAIVYRPGAKLLAYCRDTAFFSDSDMIQRNYPAIKKGVTSSMYHKGNE